MINQSDYLEYLNSTIKRFIKIKFQNYKAEKIKRKHRK